MALVLIAGPAVEPITLSEAKAHLRIDGGSEDTLLSSLIMTSRLHIEAALGLALITQNWTLLRDQWPKDDAVPLMLRPVQAVGEVRTLNDAGDPTIWESTNYIVDTAGAPGRLIKRGSGWPVPGQKANGIEIDITAGFGDVASDVPAPIRQALLLLVAHWYEHRDPIEIGTSSVAIPAAVSRLLKPYRITRL